MSGVTNRPLAEGRPLGPSENADERQPGGQASGRPTHDEAGDAHRQSVSQSLPLSKLPRKGRECVNRVSPAEGASEEREHIISGSVSQSGSTDGERYGTGRYISKSPQRRVL